MTGKPWMIYGANGYTGRLIAEQAKALGLAPILAGRGESLLPLGARLGLPVRRFALDDAAALQAALLDVSLVLNCAGPFSATAAPMMAASLKTGAHYLDITGEIAVFEAARLLDEPARRAGIVICPGVGFDVVPTDCVARALKEALPDATALSLGFDTASGLSPGTTKTLIEGLSQGGRVRRGGQIIEVPNGHGQRRIDFGKAEKDAMSIPWGDVSTAYSSTGIPDITVYVPAPRRMIRLMRAFDFARPLFGLSLVQTLLKAAATRWIKGPTPAQRQRLRSAVWGEVRNPAGERRVARIETMNGYALTVHAALHIAQQLLGGSFPAGYHTPSSLLGWRWLEQLPESSTLTITKD